MTLYRNRALSIYIVVLCVLMFAPAAPVLFAASTVSAPASSPAQAVPTGGPFSISPKTDPKKLLVGLQLPNVSSTCQKDNGNCAVMLQTAEKIMGMAEDLKNGPGYGTIVTAALGGTHAHLSQNIGNDRSGSSIDAIFTGTTMTDPVSVRNVIDAAARHGLIAEFEVTTQAEADRIRAQGADLGITFKPRDIIVVPWATGWHYSVYDRDVNPTGGTMKVTPTSAFDNDVWAVSALTLPTTNEDRFYYGKYKEYEAAAAAIKSANPDDYNRDAYDLYTKLALSQRAKVSPGGYAELSLANADPGLGFPANIADLWAPAPEAKPQPTLFQVVSELARVGSELGKPLVATYDYVSSVVSDLRQRTPIEPIPVEPAPELKKPSAVPDVALVTPVLEPSLTPSAPLSADAPDAPSYIEKPASTIVEPTNPLPSYTENTLPSRPENAPTVQIADVTAPGATPDLASLTPPPSTELSRPDVAPDTGASEKLGVPKAASADLVNPVEQTLWTRLWERATGYQWGEIVGSETVVKIPQDAGGPAPEPQTRSALGRAWDWVLGKDTGVTVAIPPEARTPVAETAPAQKTLSFGEQDYLLYADFRSKRESIEQTSTAYADDPAYLTFKKFEGEYAQKNPEYVARYDTEHPTPASSDADVTEVLGLLDQAKKSEAKAALTVETQPSSWEIGVGIMGTIPDTALPPSLPASASEYYRSSAESSKRAAEQYRELAQIASDAEGKALYEGLAKENLAAYEESMRKLKDVEKTVPAVTEPTQGVFDWWLGNDVPSSGVVPAAVPEKSEAVSPSYDWTLGDPGASAAPLEVSGTSGSSEWYAPLPPVSPSLGSDFWGIGSGPVNTVDTQSSWWTLGSDTNTFAPTVQNIAPSVAPSTWNSSFWGNWTAPTGNTDTNTDSNFWNSGTSISNDSFWSW